MVASPNGLASLPWPLDLPAGASFLLGILPLIGAVLAAQFVAMAFAWWRQTPPPLGRLAGTYPGYLWRVVLCWAGTASAYGVAAHGACTERQGLVAATLWALGAPALLRLAQRRRHTDVVSYLGIPASPIERVLSAYGTPLGSEELGGRSWTVRAGTPVATHLRSTRVRGRGYDFAVTTLFVRAPKNPAARAALLQDLHRALRRKRLEGALGAPVHEQETAYLHALTNAAIFAYGRLHAPALLAFHLWAQSA